MGYSLYTNYVAGLTAPLTVREKKTAFGHQKHLYVNKLVISEEIRSLEVINVRKKPSYVVNCLNALSLQSDAVIRVGAFETLKVGAGCIYQG